MVTLVRADGGPACGGALLRLVLEDDDLLALAVLHHGGVHLGALHHGSAHGDLVAVDDSQNLVEGHVLAGLAGQLLMNRVSPSVTLYCLPPVSMIACM